MDQGKTNTASVATRDALLSEAFISGRRAGLQGLPCPKDQPGTLEQYECMMGWRSGHAELAYSDAMRCAA